MTQQHRRSAAARRSDSGLAGGAAALAPRRRARAAPKEVKIAMLVPLSGPWARQGILEHMGAAMAIDDINNAGGIKAMGGAKLKLLEYDTQDSAEKAKDAAQRMIAQEPDLVGGFGCWLSTFTLAVTEVTERAELPWLTLSYSDLITGRGYQVRVPDLADGRCSRPRIWCRSSWSWRRRPPASGRPRWRSSATTPPRRVSFMKPIRDHVLKDPEADGRGGRDLHAAADRRDDNGPATCAARGPDFVLLQSTNVPDDKLLVDKFTEFDMPATKLPLIGNGGHWAVPELLKTAGAENLEGVHGRAGELARQGGWRICRSASSSAPASRGSATTRSSPMSTCMILKEALERAGVADRAKVAEAIRAMDMTDGPALFFPGHHLKYDDNGRRVGAELVIVQWQDGRPVTVYPPDVWQPPRRSGRPDAMPEQSRL